MQYSINLYLTSLTIHHVSLQLYDCKPDLGNEPFCAAKEKWCYSWMETAALNTMCNLYAAICSQKWCFKNTIVSQQEFIQELIFNVELTHNNYHKFCIWCSCRVFVLVLQGSYGVVKLAYNEDDDKHYVSLCCCPASQQLFVKIPHGQRGL